MCLKWITEYTGKYRLFWMKQVNQQQSRWYLAYHSSNPVVLKLWGVTLKLGAELLQVGRRGSAGNFTYNKSTCKYLRYRYGVNRLRLHMRDRNITDGLHTVAGKRKGLQALVKSVSPNVQWTHCHTQSARCAVNYTRFWPMLSAWSIS